MREWEQDAVQAMQQNPPYFAKYYAWKSFALVGVSVLAAGLAVALIMRK